MGQRVVLQEDDVFSEHPAPSLNFLHHSLTQLSLITLSPYTVHQSQLSVVIDRLRHAHQSAHP
jgi:hypothetical protein